MGTDIALSLNGITLYGNLSIPPKAMGLVLFAHGSGSSRLSPRNRIVAEALNRGNVATLLIDLLTKEEEVVDDQTAQLRFDIPLLSERLVQITNWLAQDLKTKKYKVAYFGASTGAAAALIAAAKKGASIASVVSRGGRPDLAIDFLPKVHSPTLLIVGEMDSQVIEMNREAYSRLKCKKRLEIVPGATHLFEEEGCLEKVAQLALDWFIQSFEEG